MTREQLGLFAIAYLVVVGVALGYRRRAEQWEAKANHWFARAMRAEGTREELWREHCDIRPSLRDPVKLTDEEAHRVMLILFPERRASGGKVQ